MSSYYSEVLHPLSLTASPSPLTLPTQMPRLPSGLEMINISSPNSWLVVGPLQLHVLVLSERSKF